MSSEGIHQNSNRGIFCFLLAVLRMNFDIFIFTCTLLGRDNDIIASRMEWLLLIVMLLTQTDGQTLNVHCKVGNKQYINNCSCSLENLLWYQLKFLSL